MNSQLHTNNLKTITRLENRRFEGPDACLAISLFEYGIAWKVMEKPERGQFEAGDIAFIYGIGGNGEYNRFDRVTVKDFTPDEFENEYNWADFEDVARFAGGPLKEWRQFPTVHKIQDLLQYYGYENVFGTSYWEGFEIKE